MLGYFSVSFEEIMFFTKILTFNLFWIHKFYPFLELFVI